MFTTHEDEYYLDGNERSSDVLYEVGSRSGAANRSATSAGVLPKWRLKRVQVYMERNIGESLSLAELAAAAGLSRMHFAAQFRAATGLRPHSYLLHLRIAQAKMIMATSSMPLAQIALIVGFQAQSHFSTVFKRLTNETPACWRKAQRIASTSSGDVASRSWQVEAHRPNSRS
jgi:transcriptional regulator GlxA family with amidase domain